MSLLRWMGVSPQASNQTRASSQSHPTDKSNAVVVTPADAKRLGLENFGNTCYANSVLQALYFCEPFRELVVNSPDRANLYPTPPPLPLAPLPAPQQASTSAKPATKTDAKAASSSHKRPVSGSHGTAGESSKTDAEDGNVTAVNTGPPISPNPPTIFSALRSLFIHISQHSLDKGSVAPQVFIAKLRKENELFRSTMHQDAHEFLNYLVNRVVEDIEEEEKLQRRKDKATSETDKPASLAAPATEDLSSSIITTTSVSQPVSTSSNHPKGTFIHSLFEGTLTSETRCLTCETISSRDEMFLDLSIDIEQNSSVTACLRQFSASEMLCQRNKFFCDSCCGLQEAEKRMKIKRLPNILALHLKRFKYQEELNKYVKLNYRVAFPFELRLFNTVDDATDMDRLYELWAIVVHIGSGPLHGHYITIIKAKGIWLVFDDNSVDTIREADIPKYYGDSGSGTGYVLFYQAVDLDREALGLRPVPTTTVAKELPLDVKHQNGQTSLNIPIVVDHSSPEQKVTLVDGPIPSPPPSPSVPLFKPAKVDSSPVATNQPLPTPAVESANIPSASGGGGGFLSSLRHSRSLKAKSPPAVVALNPAVPVPALPSVKTALDTAVIHHPEEGGKEEKSPGGWLSFRSKEKRRDSVSHGGAYSASASQGPSVPSSPKLAALPAPPSPNASTTVRPTTASTAPMERTPALPASMLPVPSEPSLVSVAASAAVAPETMTATSQHPARRQSTNDPPSAIDGSDSFSGSSSWTSTGVNGALDVRDIPPLPKDLPPVPPIPPTLNTTALATSSPSTTSRPLSGVTAPTLPFTLTHTSSPSTLSIANTAAGETTLASDRVGQVSTDQTTTTTGSSAALPIASTSTSSGLPPRTTKQSSKDNKDFLKAKKAAEAVARRNKEKLDEEKRKTEKALKERERMERERQEREREKAEKEQHKLAKRASRKMSLGLGGLVHWSRDKDKDKDKHHNNGSVSGINAASNGTTEGTVANGGGVHLEPAVQKALSPQGHFAPTFNF